MAAYVKVTYSVSSTTSPTCVARYERLGRPVEDWIDHVTIGSSGGTVITIEPWAPEGTAVEYYVYTFPTTGVQDLYFFSKTNEIPDRAFIYIEASYSPGYILSIDCSQSNNDITGIGESIFALNYSIQSAYLSDNITRIGRNAFEQDSGMTVCNIPESLSAIPASMFADCRSLEHIRIPDNIQSIGVSAFARCTSLQDVYIGTGLTAFKTYSFGDCSSLISITATSKNVPITYYTNTFKNVHTGGTLYYPEGYDSEYGPESGMLSTEEYLLGYYGWSGVTTGPESGYVLTSLTISDNEQHRYFAEARPGVVYSAAGQYYKTISACEARYSLYYINSYGGVDVLPFKGGGQKKTDNITSYNYSRSFRNNTTEFEEVCYLKEIKGSWLLKTGWLTTEQSLRMKELVESTCVYLYDAEEKTYTPVVMTDKKLEYKTYVNNGKKMIQYDVNVNESQSRERR